MAQDFRDKLNLVERQIAQILDVFSQSRICSAREWRPPTDIYENDKAVIVKAEIAGMRAEDFRISYVDAVLTIRGNRKDLEAKLNYHCLEIPYGEFRLRVLIPGLFNEELITAKYENGYLYVILPKIRKTRGTRKKSIE